MELTDFLDLVITASEGFFCFASGGPNVGGWSERWFRWPDERALILHAVETSRGDQNVYFSTYLFVGPSHTPTNALPTRTIQADLDDADLNDLPIEPTVLVRTSPGRHQAFWVLNEALPLDLHETISRKLTYAIPKCDHSGWPLGRIVRVPDTFNFKYLDGPKPVEVIAASYRTYDVSEFELLPEAGSTNEAADENKFLESVRTLALDIGPQELLESIKPPKINARTYLQYSSPATDRSEALWGLMCQAFKAGLERESVYWLAWHSANNKFRDLRYHAERELAKDVLRAEATVRKPGADPRIVINESRKMTPASVRKQTILAQVIDFMRQRGTFVHATNDTTWYIRRDVGRPVLVNSHSEFLDALLDLEYGLNLTEVEHNYTAAGLSNYCRNLPANAVTSALSYYDQDSNTLLLHTGRKDVLRITPTNVTTIVDGGHGVVFPWQTSCVPWSYVDGAAANYDWAEALFGRSGNHDALHNIIGMERDAAKALMRTWFLFLLFRSVAVSRPILATFGQPGSGKSTLFRKLYALLYGRQKAIGSVTKEDDFDHAVSADPLVVLDNVDSWASWLPDRLALSASTSDVVRRKLWTDSDTVVLKRQALVAITAHNPRFGREDVADRLLLLSFERLADFVPEQTIIDGVMRQRDAIWSGVVRDCQLVMATPMPDSGPQFRVEDFGRIGQWISSAIGCNEEFRAAILSIKFGQRNFSLEEDGILVSAIRRAVAFKGVIGPSTPGQLWSTLEGSSPDPQAFTRTYRNSTALGKKMLTLQDSLRLMFDADWTIEPMGGTKIWTIRAKGAEITNGHARIESLPSNGPSGALAPPTTT